MFGLLRGDRFDICVWPNVKVEYLDLDSDSSPVFVRGRYSCVCTGIQSCERRRTIELGYDLRDIVLSFTVVCIDLWLIVR